MTKSELKQVMQEHCILECEVEDVIEFVEDLLYMCAKDIEKNEPYAINTIKEYKKAADVVYDLIDYVTECMAEEAV